MAIIRDRFNGNIIVEGLESLKTLCEASRANLSETNLSEADLFGANLSGANLFEADLSFANLSEANLSGANLFEADLSEADLSEANLSRANLSRADLSEANLSFSKFPPCRLLASIQLGNLPDNLVLELMRRGAWGHPHPERFDIWAQGGNCPYATEERAWLFQESRNLWIPGAPEMKDSDLIIAICKAKGWGIKGLFESTNKVNHE